MATMGVMAAPVGQVLGQCCIQRVVSRIQRKSTLSLQTSFSGLSLRTAKSINGLVCAEQPVQRISTGRPKFVVAKLKTHKASAKRFHVTGTGKIVRRQAGKQHLNRKKTTKRKNRLSGKTGVHPSDYANVIGALPYLKVQR